METQTQQQKQTQNKRYQIIEEFDQFNQNQKVYKVIIYMNQNMLKVQERLRERFSNVPKIKVHFAQIPGDQDNVPFNFQEESQNSQNSQSLQMPSTQVSQHGSSINLSQQNQPLVKIFQDFCNRGKFDHLKYSFSSSQKKLTIKLNKKFYLNELKLKQYELIIIAQSFVKHWNDQYIQIISVFIKYQKDFKGHSAIKFYFISIDMLAVTIQIVYNDTKKFRFRYSPFQFRYHPLFRQRGLQQSLSYIDIPGVSNQNNLTPNNNQSNDIFFPSNFSDNDYYVNPKLSFMDDINNNQLLRRLIARFWVFYQIYTLNRGREDFQQFNRKVLGRVYFHSVRMKKFSLVWNFNLLHNKTSQKSVKNCGKQCQKQITLTTTFYIDEKDVKTDQKGGVQFKMIVNIAQHDHYLTLFQKQELYQRLSLQLPGNYHQRKNLNPTAHQLYQFIISLKFDQKIGKIFSKIQTMISFCIDRWAFTHYHKMYVQKFQPQKIIELQSESYIYKQNQYNHIHFLQIHIKHWYYHQHTDQKNPHVRYPSDSIELQRIYKKKLKINQKTSEILNKQQNQIIFPDCFKKYVNILLKTAPLRECYKEVIQFIQQVIKVIYSKPRQKNALTKYQNRQKVLQAIVKTLTKIFQISNYHQKGVSIKILTEESPFFVRQIKRYSSKLKIQEQLNIENSQLYAEITFNIKELRTTWIKRLPFGYMVIRMFTDKLQILIDDVVKNIMPISSNLDQKAVGQLQQKLQDQVRKLLYKDSLQNMLI